MRTHRTTYLNSWALGLCVALLIGIPGSSLPLPPPPANLPAVYTPNCPTPTYAADPVILLAALDQADYACAEELAAALRLRADPPLVAALLANAVDPDRDTRARRNSLRTLGRFAEAPVVNRARTLTLGRFGGDLQATATAILQTERDPFILQDAIWLLDRFFYPSPAAAPALERLAYNSTEDPAVRVRAANARARQIWMDGPPLSFDAVAFLHTGLANAHPGVRTAAANAIARLRSDQLTPDLYTTLNVALFNAWLAQPPLALPAPITEEPERNLLISGTVESLPTEITAHAALARARDRLQPGSHLLAELRAAYEQLALPVTHVENCAVIRADHPETALPMIARRMQLVEQAFTDLVGPELGTPIPAEFCVLTVMIFGNRTVYREYMRAFTNLGVDIDGTYHAETGTLYTHQRTAQQSSNTLEATIQHEMTHHLTARTIFPGDWSDPGYHREPKGWADEGIAEVLAGLVPTATGYELAPREAQLERVCTAAPPSLAALLARRAGYDHFGHFDYDNAWSLTYYLATERPDALRRIYAAYHAGSYRLADWPLIAGTPSLATFEAEWHAAIERWCAADQESGVGSQESEAP